MRNCPLPLVANGPSIVSVTASTSNPPLVTVTPPVPVKWTRPPGVNVAPLAIVTLVLITRIGRTRTPLPLNVTDVTCQLGVAGAPASVRS